MKSYYILFLMLASLIFCSSFCDDDEDSRPVFPEPDLPRARLIYPRGYQTASRSPLFIWGGNPELDTDNSFEFSVKLYRGTMIVDRRYFAGSDTVFQCPDTLDAATGYRWKVETRNSEGLESNSYSEDFTTTDGFNNPPFQALRGTPLQNEEGVPLDVHFSWYPSDPDGDDTTCDLRISHVIGGTSIVIRDLLTTEHYVVLKADNQYHWRVTTRDTYGDSSVSSNGNFYTITTPPPHDPFPSDGAEDVPLDVTLTWNCTDPDGDNLTYDVEMGLAGGSMSSIGTGLVQDELPIVGLNEGTVYEWKVTAEDVEDHRTEGPAWSFTTLGAPGDIFADLSLTRQITKNGVEILVIDNIWARFDERYAPYYWLSPLRPDTVICEDIGLTWQDSRNRFYYENSHTLTFLVPGTTYEFSVTQGGGVPALTESIHFPQCAPQITSPAAFDPISLDGFTVTWTGFDEFTDCDRQISIAIEAMGGAPTGVYVTTENDGSYTFTAGELSAIDPSQMDLQIVLIVENIEYIDSPGYDPRSWIRARTRFEQPVYNY